MILVLIIVISIPLFILWKIKEAYRKKALDIAQQLPIDIQHLLKASAGYTEITMKERLQHSLRIIIIGLIIYIIGFSFGIVKNAVSDSALDFKSYFWGALVLLAFIIIFILRDLFKVAPWSEVYRIKAIHCLTIHGAGHAVYVCYYDFIKEELAVDALPDTSSIAKINTSQEGLFDVLVAAKNHRLKLIDIIK